MRAPEHRARVFYAAHKAPGHMRRRGAHGATHCLAMRAEPHVDAAGRRGALPPRSEESKAKEERVAFYDYDCDAVCGFYA